MNAEENKYVNLLSVFHYVVGGLTALISCIFLLHFFVGLAMVTGMFPMKPGDTPPPQLFGWFFVVMGAVFVFGGWTIAVSMIVAGIKLKKHKARIFCMVVAGIECMFMPFGTVLGVFTLILLNKDSIKQAFVPVDAS